MTYPAESPAAAPPRLEFRTFGPPAVLSAEGEPVAGLSGKPLALLCYLASSGRARREEVMALLWGDAPESRAGNALRQTLHRIRAAGADLIVRDGQMLRLAERPELLVDLASFEAALSMGDTARAIELYRGEFLEGFDVGEPAFAHWIDAERQRLHLRFQRVLHSSIEEATRAGRTSDAAAWAEALVRLDPLDPDSAVTLARLLLATGRAAEARARLADFETHFRRECGIDPPAAIQQIASALQAGAAASTAFDESAADPSRSAAEPAGGRAPSRLVGRERELGQLVERARSLQDGGGTCVIVEGPSGSGKTRLLHELATAVRTLEDALVLSARESQALRHVPYASIADALRSALRAPGIGGASGHLLAEAARLVPELRDRFALPDTPPIEDSTALLRFYEGVAAMLEAIAYEQPVALLIDDAHHAPRLTTDLLLFLAARLRGSPVLIVLCSSTGPPAGWGAAERGGAGASDAVQRLALGELTPEASAELLSDHTREAPLDPELMGRIVAHGGGNPGRLLELLRQHRMGLPLDAPLVRWEEVLLARYERQPAPHRRMLLGLSLLGRPASLRLLAAATHLSEPQTLDAATALEAAGLLVQAGGGVLPASPALSQQVIDQAGPAGRSLLAGWTADALAAERSREASRLAELYGIAGRRAETFEYARIAADQAILLGATSEAVHFLQMAAETAPDESTRSGIEERLRAAGAGSRRLTPGHRPRAGFLRRRPALFRALRLLALAVVGGAAIVLVRREVQRPAVTRVLTDTLLMVDRSRPAGTGYFAAFGPLSGAAENLVRTRPREDGPAWMDSIALPWMNASPSPSGDFVALERMVAGGTDLYLLSADRRDTLQLTRGPADNLHLGWSPDGAWVLASRSRRLPDGSYDTDLVALPTSAERTVIAIDTSAARSVIDAAWSPDGTWIAWTAEAPGGGQEIYASPVRGGTYNLSRHPAEDRNPVWSPDGSRLVFTSSRNGNADIYGVEVPTLELYRLTREDYDEHHPKFSPDGRLVAYEAAAQPGNPRVYVVPARGGEVTAVSPAARPMTLVGWRSEPPPYIDDLRILLPEPLAPGGATGIVPEAVYSDGTLAPLLAGVTWSVLDPAVIRADSSDGAAGAGLVLRAGRQGVGRIVADLGGWRADTAWLKVGRGPVLALDHAFGRSGDLDRQWRRIGSGWSTTARSGGVRGVSLTLPASTSAAGIITREQLPLVYGVTLQVRVRIPASGSSEPAEGLTIAWVEPQIAGPAPASTARPPAIASITWLPGAGRIAYAAGRSVWSEPLVRVGDPGTHLMRIDITAEGVVTFIVDGVRRRAAELDPTLTGRGRGALVYIGTDGGLRGAAVERVSAWIGIAEQR